MAVSGVSRVLLLLLAGMLLILPGCQQYGSVSPQAWEIATAIYAVSNRQDAARLPAVDAVISEAFTAQQISESEQQALRQMLKDAEAGRWQKAMDDARTMLEEQVKKQ